jgi:hypothetical protein
MTDPSTPDAGAQLRDAARVQNRTRAATRWFTGYALLMGLAAFALVVAVEVFFPSGLTRLAAAAGWAVAVGLLGWWADSHGVYPQRAARRLLVATAVWFGTYLLAVGPLVRWQAGQSAGWWVVAAAALASPFLVVAWAGGTERRRP